MKNEEMNTHLLYLLEIKMIQPFSWRGFSLQVNCIIAVYISASLTSRSLYLYTLFANSSLDAYHTTSSQPNITMSTQVRYLSNLVPARRWECCKVKSS